MFKTAEVAADDRRAAAMCADMAADFRRQAAAMEDAAAPSPHCSTVEGQGWIVVDGVGALTFTRDETYSGKGFRYTATGRALPHKANRFTEADAKRLAVALRGRAVHWRDACRDLAASFRRCADRLAD